MTKFIYTLGLLLLFQYSLGQNIKATSIPGKWVLNKYTEIVKGKVVDKTEVEESIYIFLANGTYNLTAKSGKEVFVNKGKWKVVANGKKVQLYDNIDDPNDTNVEIADHQLDVKYRNGKYYLTYTSGDALNGPRTDYYVKFK